MGGGVDDSKLAKNCKKRTVLKLSAKYLRVSVLLNMGSKTGAHGQTVIGLGRCKHRDGEKHSATFITIEERNCVCLI